MGNYSKHVIEVETKFVTVNGKSMVDSKKTIEGLGRGVTQTTTSMRDWDSEGKKMISTGRTLTKGFQKFQMENLGVMFAGMALNRTMSTLNATSREWLGIGELTSTMMGITMLDANMDLLQFGILPLFDALINLPPAAQKAIGLTAIALEGLGGAMMIGGQLMLGLDSTATLLAKIAGVRPEIIFTTKGMSALKTNLAPIAANLGKIASYAGAGITIAMALQDLKEGDVTAAVGDAFMAAGFLSGGGKKGAVLFTVGIGLKLIGEDKFSSSIAALGIGMLDTFMKVMEWLGDSIKAIFSRQEIDWGGVGDLFEEFDEVAAKKVLNGDKTSRYLVDRLNLVGGAEKILTDQYLADLEEIEGKYEDGSEAATSAMSEIENEYSILFTYQDEAIAKQQKYNDLWNNLDPKIKSIFGQDTSSSNWWDKKEEPEYGFSSMKSEAIGGNIANSGSYYLHEGETVLRKDQAGNQSGNVTVTYNVNVSDKREFEQMLRANNDKLTADVRRMSQV